MASLTESYSISEQMRKDRKPESNEWYDRVYLCWEDTNFKNPTTFKPITGFKCYRYNSFASADYAWDNHIETEQKLEIRHTMIPICKWFPEMFDKYILNYKLRNMYWLGKNSIGYGFNIYK